MNFKHTLCFDFFHVNLPIVIDNTLLLEIDDEVGSLSHLTFDVDWATMCINNLFADAEA